MSEFQYYEWQAVDRPLTNDEVRQVGRLSSHMDVVTSTHAVVTYQWGDFKHDPAEVMLRYFDAMLYSANWGTRRLMFRFPQGSVDAEQVSAYWVDDWMTLREQDGYHVLDIDIGGEPGDWGEEPESLGALLPLRQQIIEGDYRALYLAWLAAAQAGEGVVEEQCEPPVPPGLRELNSSLQTFVDGFLEIDPWLLQVAARDSEPLQRVADEALAGALAQLPPEEARAYLLRVLRNEPQVRRDLRKRLTAMTGAPGAPPQGRRSVAQLLAEAQRLRQAKRRRQEKAAERERRQELDELAGRKDAVWREVESLVERRQARAYREAVALLKRLRELAVYRNELPEFTARLDEIRYRYGRLRSFIEQLDRAGLGAA